jgi:hypothetical protein
MFQRLQQTRTQIEADLLISRLRAAGLHPSDLRVWPHVSLAGGDLFYGIEVPAEEVETANQILRGNDGNGETVRSGGSAWIALRIAIAIVIAAIAGGMLLP